MQRSPSSHEPHCVHDDAPGAELYVPAGQGSQTVSAFAAQAVDAYVPGAQAVQALHAPSSLRNDPLGHVPQSDGPGPEHVVQLGSQAAQTVSVVAAQSADLYVPSAQVLQAAHVPAER